MNSTCKLIFLTFAGKAYCLPAALCQLISVPPTVLLPRYVADSHGMHKHCNMLWQPTLEEAMTLGIKQ